MSSILYFVGSGAELRKKSTFAICTLLVLWALGGGSLETFSQRILYITPVYFFLAWNDWGQNRSQLFSFRSVIEGLVLGIGVAILPGIVLYLASTQPAVESVVMSGGPVGWAQDLLMDASRWTLLSVLSISLFWTPFWALISRETLQKDWGGPLGLAFVDSLIIGIGSQSAALFVGSFLLGYAGAWIRIKRGIGQAVWAQAFACLALGLITWILAPKL